MSSLHRAQILIETEQHKALSEIAEREGRSISAVVREIIRVHLAEREQQTSIAEAMQALEELTAIRKKIREEHGVYQGDVIREIRHARDDDFKRIWQGGE
jgi:translation elongation factor EF-4